MPRGEEFRVVPETPTQRYLKVVTCRAGFSIGKEKFAQELERKLAEWREEGYNVECTDRPGDYEIAHGFCARVVFHLA